MPMREIAAKIEKKRLLDEFDILKKLNGEGQEVTSKEEILQVIKAKEKELLEEISYLEKKEALLVGGVFNHMECQKFFYIGKKTNGRRRKNIRISWMIGIWRLQRNLMLNPEDS